MFKKSVSVFGTQRVKPDPVTKSHLSVRLSVTLLHVINRYSSTVDIITNATETE